MFKTRLALALLAVSLVVAACGGAAETAEEGDPGRAGVAAVDDEFAAPIVRIPVGGSVRWTQQGTNPHNVVAADGGWTSPEVMVRGDRYERQFDEPGVYPYFCTFHGTAEGQGMAGFVLVGDEAQPPIPAIAQPAVAQPTGTVLEVPGQYPTIQAAVDAAVPGDLVLVAPGIYPESVTVSTPSVVIRGVERNSTILDGGFERIHGVIAVADGVVVENMTARHYVLNGFYWTGVTGYRGSYLTAYNNGDYGLYAFDSVDGLFEHSYASGHPDSGFYIGQCYPCEAVIRDSLAEWNALGYSGTNAGGHLYLIESIWRDNMIGIVPNSLDSELNPPHRETTIAANLVHDNNNPEAPTRGFGRQGFGNGIVLAGGVGDVVVGNVVLNHRSIGIVAAAFPDESIYFSQHARVEDNVVAGSGIADLALIGPWGPGNCFEDNLARRAIPAPLFAGHPCDSGLRLPMQGDLSGLMLLLGTFVNADRNDTPAGGDWQTTPAPPAQPAMPQPMTDPARPAVDVFQPPVLSELTAPEPPDGLELRAQEVIMSGIPVSEPNGWQLLFGIYGYFLPIVLFAAWAALAIWDLARRDLARWQVLVWLAVILLVPFLGVIAYHVVGRSTIPAWFRGAVVGGGALAYVVILALGALMGGVV